MRNILHDGEKPEIIKIMPFGKTVALALLLALSGCVKKNHDPKTFPEQTSISESDTTSSSDVFENIEVVTTTNTDHPDYEIITENWAKTIVLKTDWEIYIRTTANTSGRTKSFIGSYDNTDTLEYEMPEGTFVIKSFDKK